MPLYFSPVRRLIRTQILHNVIATSIVMYIRIKIKRQVSTQKILREFSNFFRESYSNIHIEAYLDAYLNFIGFLISFFSLYTYEKIKSNSFQISN